MTGMDITTRGVPLRALITSAGAGGVVVEVFAQRGALIALVDQRVGEPGLVVAGTGEDALVFVADLWRQVIGTNVTGCSPVCRTVVDDLRSTGRGSIVSFTSHLAGTGVPGRARSTVAEAGVAGSTHGVVLELRPTIRANVVCASPVDTPERHGHLAPDVPAGSPPGRSSRPFPEHIVDPVQFARATWVLGVEEWGTTGASLVLDGGASAA